MNKGTLYIVSAPAGCGKDTILEKVLTENSNLFYSVSATSRKMRDGEIDGVSYFFKSREQFEEMLANGELLEHTEYCGNYYGTPKQAVVDMLAAGKDVILKIEVEGAANVKAIFPQAVMIFILPPSLTELRRRLHKRGTEDDATIEKRIAQAKNELSLAKNYDFIVVNDALEDAIIDFNAVINAGRLTAANNADLIANIAGD